MKNPVLAGVFVSLVAASVEAAPPPRDFQVLFEQYVHRGGYAVVRQDELPTTPVHGADGKQVDAYYSIDVKEGSWKPSSGFMDLNQVQTSTLRPGELMEVVDVTFKDGSRIDLRMVTVEPHEVLRPKTGAGLEAASTNFKFFFPFPLRSALDVAPALAYMERYVRVFRGLEEARGWSARAFPAAAAPAAAPASTMVKSEIKPGMTPLEVLEALGKPKSELSSGARSKWTYPAVTVVFENGRVKEVVF